MVLKLFGELSNQLILTTTLKLEEKGKYNTEKRINHIDYSEHSPSHILEQTEGNTIDNLLKAFAL
jgi:hypothetical protein